jgi:RHS repeat-associated protein
VEQVAAEAGHLLWSLRVGVGQALSSPCGLFSLTQGTAPYFQDETTDSIGSEMPAVFDLQLDPIAPCPGGGEDPPTEPGAGFVERFHHRDHLGTLRVITDEAGWQVAALDFYPFGLSMGTGDTGSRRKYTGHERDEETGADYMMARYKQTRACRFMSPDPIFDTSLAAPRTWNRYGYVHGDPISRWDPSGRSVNTLYLLFRKIEIVNVTASAPQGWLMDSVLWVLKIVSAEDGGSAGTHGGSAGGQVTGGGGDGISVRRKLQSCGPEPQFPHAGFWKPKLKANFGVATQLSLIGWTARVVPRDAGPGLGEWDYKRSTNPGFQAHDPETFGNVNYGATGYAVGLSLHTLQRAGGVVGFIRNGPGDNSRGVPFGWPGVDLPGPGPGIVGMPPVWPFGDSVEDAHAIAAGYDWAKWHQCMLDNAS